MFRITHLEKQIYQTKAMIKEFEETGIKVEETADHRFQAVSKTGLILIEEEDWESFENSAKLFLLGAKHFKQYGISDY